MWGQAAIPLDGEVARGIIPTRVGTSMGDSPENLYREDHPHACGDKAIVKLADYYI